MSAKRRARMQVPGPHRIDGYQTATTDAHLTALDELAEVVDGVFVVVVRVTGGRYRRRCFLSLRAAENATRRAADRGETATVMLCQLAPLWKVRA